MRVNLRDIAARAADGPAIPLLEAVGNLDAYTVCHNNILVATYIAPEKIGSIYLADRRIDEDRFQGRAALVLKVGPQAFVDDGRTVFGGITVKPGDWVVFRPSSGSEIFLRDRRKVNDGVSCRIVQDAFIEMVITDPSLVY